MSQGKHGTPVERQALSDYMNLRKSQAGRATHLQKQCRAVVKLGKHLQRYLPRSSRVKLMPDRGANELVL